MESKLLRHCSLLLQQKNKLKSQVLLFVIRNSLTKRTEADRHTTPVCLSAVASRSKPYFIFRLGKPRFVKNASYNNLTGWSAAGVSDLQKST